MSHLHRQLDRPNSRQSPISRGSGAELRFLPEHASLGRLNEDLVHTISLAATRPTEPPPGKSPPGSCTTQQTRRCLTHCSACLHCSRHTSFLSQRTPVGSRFFTIRAIHTCDAALTTSSVFFLTTTDSSSGSRHPPVAIYAWFSDTTLMASRRLPRSEAFRSFANFLASAGVKVAAGGDSVPPAAAAGAVPAAVAAAALAAVFFFGPIRAGVLSLSLACVSTLHTHAQFTPRAKKGP